MRATIKKYYPIENRRDFFKYYIKEGEEIKKDMFKREMYFDDISEAERVCKAINTVKAKREDRRRQKQDLNNWFKNKPVTKAEKINNILTQTAFIILAIIVIYLLITTKL